MPWELAERALMNMCALMPVMQGRNRHRDIAMSQTVLAGWSK